MKIDPATVLALSRAAETIRYQAKAAEIARGEERLRQERIRLQHIRPTDPDKGQNVDTLA